MTNDVTRLAWYRFTCNRFGGRASLIAVVLLVGLVGGLGIACITGARATENSYARLLADSNPSALSLTFEGPLSTAALSKLPGVTHIETDELSLLAVPLSATGAPAFTRGIASGKVGPEASIDGEFFNQDKASVVAGRMANPHRADEFVTTALAERLMGWHVDQRILMGFYTNAQADNPNFGKPSLQPKVKRLETLVGTVVFTSAVVQDEVDEYPAYYLLTPAATRPFLNGPQYVQYNFQISSSSSVAKVEREVIKALPPDQTYTTHSTSVIEGQIDRSIRPEGLALGVFGVLAFLAALLIGLQVIGRRLRLQRNEQVVMRALGASRAALVADWILGPVLAIIGGAVLAFLVALVLSQFTLIGPVRPLLPGGVHVDFPVLVSALAFLLVVLIGTTLFLARRLAPGRLVPGVRVSSGSRLAKLATSAGLPVSAVTGMHFAFESGAGRRSVPVRSVLTGVVLAVTLICTTLTFASGLSTLVSHPSLYGWNWNYGLTTSNKVPPASLAVLQHNSDILQFSGANFADVQIDGVTEPTLLTQPNVPVSSPLLSGHGVRTLNEIVLGAATMAQLHKRVGETVLVSYGTKNDYPAYVPPTRLTIVGTATLPAVGLAGTLHPSMGDGVIIDENIEPIAFRKVLRSQQLLSGDDVVFVRLRPGVSRAAGEAVLHQAVRAGNAEYAALPHGEGDGDKILILGVQYPAEIINYRSIGNTPLWLAMAFALGVMLAFGLTIATSVRLRRRELALLKTLGFTRRQIVSCISWQASASVLSGLVLGIPLGIVAGRELWVLFARQIYAVPLATVPVVSLVVLSAAAFVLANLVAIVPSRMASRTPAGVALRAE